jgi:5-(carboxyamino)imidazole ribonucleotide synthase
MSALAAYRLGYHVAILDHERHTPAGEITHLEFVGSLHNRRHLRRLARHADFITLENEFVDTHRLEYLERHGHRVVPSSRTIALIQDKLLQKEALRRRGIPVPRFLPVETGQDYAALARQLGRTFLLKSRKMGYDGYGNALVRSERTFHDAHRRLTLRHTKLMAEEYVPFTMELAVMVVRTRREIATYPVVQTIQRNHICHTVIAPAPVAPPVARRAREVALRAVRAVGGYGLYGVELFVRKDGAVLVNEMAPRPHNSGHYTIDACVTSQFENHVRSVLGLPLGSTAMTRPYAVMINLLGTRDGRATERGADSALRHPDVRLHVYGKRDVRRGRKMGHITVTGESLTAVLALARRAAGRVRL